MRTIPDLRVKISQSLSEIDAHQVVRVYAPVVRNSHRDVIVQES